MEEHCPTFRDYTTGSWFNTMIKCSISRTNAIAVQHISSQHYSVDVQYYCLVSLYYTNMILLNQRNAQQDPLLYFLMSMTYSSRHKVDRYESKVMYTYCTMRNVM